MSDNKPTSGDTMDDPINRAKTGHGTEKPALRPDLPEAAQRALREAEERRIAANQVLDPGPVNAGEASNSDDKGSTDLEKEINGRGGLDPVRYGDWEIKGITSDF